MADDGDAPLDVEVVTPQVGLLLAYSRCLYSRWPVTSYKRVSIEIIAVFLPL